LRQTVIYLGFGSNLGDKVNNCLGALKELSASAQNYVRAVSSLYKTEPIGYVEQDWFINCVAEVITPLSPRSLHQCLRGIEKRMGRKRIFRWGPRTIDLDILLYGTEIIEETDLTIPHPRFHERSFVLIPLSELAPNLFHPVLKKTIRELLERIDVESGVELYAAPPDITMLR
jgi:2-amino-4-hydroxy-6-hydroxymethyldihydropteridine diphosphokinase